MASLIEAVARMALNLRDAVVVSCLRIWMRQTGLDKNRDLAWCPVGDGHVRGNSYKTYHLNTERIADISAMFCIELMTHGTPESAVSAPEREQQEINGRQLKSSRAALTTKKTKIQINKMGVIFGALQSGLKAEKYCTLLDERLVRPPDHWIEEDCPPTYAQAYKDAKWRKRIQDEKCRYREQYEKASIPEREAIIQRTSGTRHTRH